MFDALSDRFQQIFRTLRGHGGLTEVQLDEGLKEIRLALLEADVNYRVVKDFVKKLKGQALGAQVLQSLTPGQQVIKLVRDELIELLGTETTPLEFPGDPPWVILLVGLQGSGKTTTAGKLAGWLAGRKHSPFLVPADFSRPAAVAQLQKVAAAVGVPVMEPKRTDDPVKRAVEGLKHARDRGFDVVIVDSAGRLHIDESLMGELERMKAALSPTEILLVTDAMTGQDAVRSASEFDQKLGLSGVILTKLDGDARGGAALSIKAVTGKPIKFVGVGERYDAIELFQPDRLVSRVLGMGDVLSLIEKAEHTVDVEEAQRLHDRLRQDGFTLEDFRLQLGQLRRMGPLDQLLQLIPGLSRLKGSEQSLDEHELTRAEAILGSMTSAERQDHALLNGSRRKRIARGSGNTVQDVNRLVKQFVQSRKLMKRLGPSGLMGLGKARPGRRSRR